MISAKDEPDEPISPAMDGLLRIHTRITDGSDGELSKPQQGASIIGPTRLLVPASQAGSLIGKQGATIKSIQDASKSVVRIVGKAFILFICSCARFFLSDIWLCYIYIYIFVTEHMPCPVTLLRADQNKRNK